MTPLERTEKIFLHCNWIIAADADKAREWIAAQIEEACAEAYQKGMEHKAHHSQASGPCPECFKEGFSAARDKAVGIVTDAAREFFTQEWLADRISKMKP